mgnify:CR=1 FL=1
MKLTLATSGLLDPRRLSAWSAERRRAIHAAVAKGMVSGGRDVREAARALAPQLARPGSDYVFIARMGTTERAWDRLLDDVKSTLTRLATPRHDRGAAKPSPARAPSGQDRQNP